MKCFMLTILIYSLFPFLSTVSAQWIAQKTSHSNTLYCVKFNDENNGLISGSGVLARTTNGGLDWRSEERRVGKECRSRWSPYH